LRVFILDDHELVRRGLQELLENEGFLVVGMSGSAEEAARRIPALRPDISVLDARLPDGTGIEVCRNVRSVDPSLNCVILTSYDDEQALRGAIIAGAAGYILKEIGGSDLLGALRRAAHGESLFDEAVKARVVQGLTEPKRDEVRRRRPDQPANRRRDAAGREDRQELRVLPAGQVGIRTPDAGGGLHGA
jgi:DNA-binding NarL/FixJ family response regulator